MLPKVYQDEEEFKWKNKDKYKWNIYNSGRLYLTLIGINNNTNNTDKSKNKVIVKIYEKIFDDSKKCLEVLKEINFLLSFKNNIFTNNLIDIIGINKEEEKENINYNKLFLIYDFYGVELNKMLFTDIFDYRKQKGIIKWIILQLIQEVYYIHSLGIIHRDIRPSNILINNFGKIIINDFNLAISQKMNKKFYSKEGILAYMAPEYLLSNNYNYNEKIDMWSIGVTFLELITKESCFFTDKNNINLYRGDVLKKPIIQLKYYFDKLKIKIDNENEIWNNETKIGDYIFNNKLNDIDFVNILKNFEEVQDLINDKDALDLLKGLLKINPNERISAKEALNSNYFKEYNKYINLNIPKISIDTSFEEKYYKINNENDKIKFLKKQLKNMYNNLHS